jgi:hypothetical protein
MQRRSSPVHSRAGNGNDTAGRGMKRKINVKKDKGINVYIRAFSIVSFAGQVGGKSTAKNNDQIEKVHILKKIYQQQ